MLDEFTRAQRTQFLGSSDMAAVTGHDPWGRTRADVWAEKTGRVAPSRTSMPMVLGTYLESSILQWTEDVLETPLQRDQFVIHAGGILAANLDAVAPHRQPPAIIEAKTAGLIGRPRYLDDFGTAGTDEVPTHILVQAHHQLACVEAQPGWPSIRDVLVPALLVGRGFVLYQIEKNAELCAALVEDGTRFWQDHILTDTPPPEAPMLETLRQLRRTALPTVALDRDLVATWLAAREVTKEVTKDAAEQEEQYLRGLIWALGGQEAGVCDLGTFSYREQVRKAYSVPEARFRVPRFTKAKGR